MIKLVVSLPPGEPTDVASPITGKQLSDGLKEQIVAENPPGASGMTGAKAVEMGSLDSYTLDNARHIHPALPALGHLQGYRPGIEINSPQFRNRSTTIDMAADY